LTAGSPEAILGADSRVVGSADVKKTAIKPQFFATPEDFRAWLAENHDTAGELWVGFYKVSTGRPSINWPQSVDEALCVGWIDGIRKRVDDHSYVIRFTPRRPTSIWSAVNIRRMAELIAAGRVLPAGLAAFGRRSKAKSGTYSYEQRGKAMLDRASKRLFRADAAAWKHFQAQAPGYRQIAVWWVVSAKKEETRQRRLAALIEACARGRRIGVMEQPDKAK
jgi:uncharacterized protein YdeI (YjbR/CyaY-like superfamily)